MASPLPRIGILGSGNMGRSLGIRLANRSYQVFFGARRPEQATAAAAAAGPNARAGSVAEAASFGTVLVWTMRERDPARVLGGGGGGGGDGDEEGRRALDGKVVIDLNNRDYATEVVGSDGGAGGGGGTWFEQSLGEKLQANVPEAKVVKAFNTVAMEALDTSERALREAGAQIFVAGADDGSRKVVRDVAADLGWRSVDLGGGPTAMRAAEALGDVIRFAMIDGKLGGRANIRIDTLPAPDLGQIGQRQESHYH